jgi:SAM-dependent methyltransferase
VTAIILTGLVVAGLIVNGLRLRARVPSVLPAADSRPGGQADGVWTLINSRETTVDDATRAAAVAYALAEELAMVDLVPADLPATAARDLVRRVDPRAYRTDRLAGGCSAGAALLVAQPVLTRAGVSVPDEIEPADVIDTARRIRPYAGGHGAAIAVAPWLRSAANDLAKRRARLVASGVIVPIYLTLEATPYALTVMALLTGWEWSVAAAVAYCLQPYLIFAGTAMRPRGLHIAALLRPVHDPYVWARTVAGRWRSAAELERDAELAAAVPYYRDALAKGTARFLEERRATCPWCGSAELSVLVRSRDLVLGKPGMFTLERCGDCGHVFQNPRLRPDGLDFYYRDAYDGIGKAGAEAAFIMGGDAYRARARMLEPFTTPKAWLDVGAGHAHFCAIGTEIWPDTVFDGLDQGAAIEDAERRGWITTAYRDEFRDLAGALSGRYDVVSMHHYLEHTRDPAGELDAAARVLPPGGYLLIELPDPQWPLARLFGQYWMPWFQPQHQHMIPVGNLTKALAERGLRPVAIERGPAHQACDFTIAALLCVSRVAPDRTLPWSRRPPTVAARAWRSVAWTAATPFIFSGLLLDLALGRFLARRWDCGNAYRVLARREGSDDDR